MQVCFKLIFGANNGIMSFARKAVFADLEYFECCYTPLGIPPRRSVYFYMVDGILIDTAQSKMRYAFKEIISEKKLQQVVITHSHEDHAGNISVCREMNIPVFGHRLAVENVKNPASIPLIEKWVWGAADSADIQEIGEFVETENHIFEVIHTPGHSEDHICFYLPSLGWLFSGDLFVARHIKYFITGENMAEQINSIRKVLELDFDVLFCSHNPQLQNGKKALESKLEFLQEFYGKVSRLYYEGLDKNGIMQRMQIKENKLLKLLSDGQISAKNMISSVVKTEQGKLFKNILSENLVD